MNRYCLIFQSSPVIARDLAMTLQDLTGCDPILVPDLGSAETAVADLGDEAELAYAFVHLGVSDYRKSRLQRLLDGRRARVVLLGHEAETEVARSEWPVLAQPFSTDQVADLLARVEASAASGACEEGLR